jgi:Flp pilus assembly CpaE family ATPase
VALNVATCLAGQSRVVLVELQPSLATLPHYFRRKERHGSLPDLLKMARLGPVQVESCLWPCLPVPGLRILFGPQNLTDGAHLDPALVKELLQVLSVQAEFVVLDLPAGLSTANCVAIQASQVLGLVLDRDPVCLSMAARVLREIESIDPVPQVMGTVVVSRAPVAIPGELAAIEKQLNLAPLGVIAPAPDQFLAAQHARIPVVTMDPESVAAGTLAALAQTLGGTAMQRRVPAAVPRTGERQPWGVVAGPSGR